LQAADWIALASLIVAFIALFVAVYAIRKGNRNASVATLVTIYEAFREAWRRFRQETDPAERDIEFADLMNTLEIACAILNEKSFSGVSRKLMETYLDEVLKEMKNNTYANAQINSLFSAPTTFEHIRHYYETRKKNIEHR